MFEKEWKWAIGYGVGLVAFCIFAFFMALSLGPCAKKAHGQSPEEIRSLYDQGFELVMQGIPDFKPDKADQTIVRVDSIKMLSLLKTFKTNSTSWAYVKKGAYLAMENGSRANAWLAIVPKHDLFYQQSPLFIIEDSPEVNILRIKAVPVTPHWAGIFLAHELCHLLDRALSWQARLPTRRQYLEAEVKAFATEIFLVNRLTADQFSSLLQQFLAEKKLADQSQVASFIKQQDNLGQINQMFELMVGGLSAGDDERANRLGFFAVALCFKAIEKNFKPGGQPGKERLAAEAAIIERLMIETGLNRFLPKE